MRKASLLSIPKLGPKWGDPVKQKTLQLIRKVGKTETCRSVIVLEIMSPYELEKCPHLDCGGSLRRSGRPRHRYWDLPIGNVPSMVEIIHQNYQCRDCDRFPTPPAPELDDRRGATKRFVDYVSKRALSEKFSDVAWATGLHNTSVRDYFLERIEQRDRERRTPALPKCVWLHRIRSVRTCSVVADLMTEKTIDVIPSEDRLEQFLQTSVNSQTESFAIDVHEPYHTLVQKIAPRAVIFVPRFALLTFSMAQMKPLLVWAGRTAKTHQQHNVQKLIDAGRRPQKINVLHQLLKHVSKTAVERVKTACQLYLGFVEILRSDSAPAAERLFDGWIKSIPSACEPHLADFVETLQAWREEIFNPTAFEKITPNQGRELATHIGGIIKEGRGYDYDVLRGKLLYGPTASAAKIVKVRNASGFEPEYGADS